MIIKWGRKGLVAGAFAATFVTPVADTTSYIHEVQHRPSFKQEVRHITPASADTNTIKRAYLRPGIQFEFRHVTPVEVAAVEDTAEGFTHYGPDHRIQEAQDLIAIIMALYESEEV